MTEHPTNDTPSYTEIGKLHKQWLELQPLQETNNIALWLWIRMNFDYHSNHFEGNTLTYEDTQLLLMYGRTKGEHKLREYMEMNGHDAAFDYILELAQNKNRLLNEKDIQQLNILCLVEPFHRLAYNPHGDDVRVEITPGRYKVNQNYVITSEGKRRLFATPEETPQKMTEFVKWTHDWLNQDNSQKHATLVPFIAELHQRFINIHPFADGNGRAVRLLINYILTKHDYLPSVLSDRTTYIDAIQKSDINSPGPDRYKPLENLFANNIKQMLEKGIYASKHVIQLNEKLVSVAATTTTSSFER